MVSLRPLIEVRRRGRRERGAEVRVRKMHNFIGSRKDVRFLLLHKD